jgi:cytochrome oxidase Cu insertion factor (SCO1/SenC/PrrC family)
MKKLFSALLMAVLSVIYIQAKAQLAPSGIKTTYILPDGRLINADKLDSIRLAWGADRVIMRHNDDDDHNHIVRLEQLTDKMMQEMAANAAAGLETLKTMLGHTAIDFTLTDLKGNKVQLSKLRGKVVVVNFWFTACPPCIAEMPDMNQVAKDYAKRNVVFLAVTFNDKKTVEEFLKNHEFGYRIFPKSNDAISLYKIHNYPTHLIIGKDGVLKQFIVSGENLKALLIKAINEQIS